VSCGGGGWGSDSGTFEGSVLSLSTWIESLRKPWRAHLAEPAFGPRFVNAKIHGQVARPFSYFVAAWGYFSLCKATGVWCWPLPSNAEVKNCWRCTSAHPCTLMSCTETTVTCKWRGWVCLLMVTVKANKSVATAIWACKTFERSPVGYVWRYAAACLNLRSLAAVLLRPFWRLKKS
jgi:hypothetical protein